MLEANHCTFLEQREVRDMFCDHANSATEQLKLVNCRVEYKTIYMVFEKLDFLIGKCCWLD